MYCMGHIMGLPMVAHTIHIAHTTYPNQCSTTEKTFLRGRELGRQIVTTNATADMYCKHQKRWALTCTVLAPRSMNSAAWLPVSTPPIPERDLSWPGNSALIIWAIDMTFASAIGLTALDEYPPGVEYLLETHRRPAFVQSVNWCNVQLLDQMGSMARSHNPLYEIRQIHKSIILCNEGIIFCIQRFLVLYCLWKLTFSILRWLNNWAILLG